MAAAVAETLEHVVAPLNYLVPGPEKPVAYAYEPPPGVPRRTGDYAAHAVKIRNGRAVLPDLSLDRNGFVLVSHPTAVKSFYDENEVRKGYFREVERLVQAATGAAKVVVFDYNVRNAAKAQRDEDGAKEPVRRVHNDYTADSAPRRVRDLLGAEEAEARLRHRVVEINMWRPIRGPVQETPLAVCDARSIAPADLVPTELRFPDRTGVTYSVTHNPAHRWFYFPEMQRGEALLLKGYDSATDGRARFTAHTAFDDPRSPPGAAPRESIEVRSFAFFGG